MRIRDLQEQDFSALFEIQSDPDSRWMAAFGSKDSNNKEAFSLHLSKIMADTECIYKVVEHEGQIVGNVGKWVSDSGPELTYWTDKKFMGQGITSAAVKEFLAEYEERPLYAHTAGDNLASQAILIKLGFSKYEEIMSFSDIGNMEIVEFGLVLN